MYLFCILHHTKHIQDKCFINIYWTQLFLAEKRETNISVSYGGARATMISSFMPPTTFPEKSVNHHRLPVLMELMVSFNQHHNAEGLFSNLVFAKQETERL